MSDSAVAVPEDLTPADLASRAALAKAKAGELLDLAELRAIFHLGKTQFWKLHKAGDFDHLKVRPAIGTRCVSGTLVHRYVSGDNVYTPTFGRKRGSR